MMPSYSIDVNGETFSFDSDVEIDESQAKEFVNKQLVSPTKATKEFVNKQEVTNQPDFLSALERRVSEAGEAAVDIPSSVAGKGIVAIG